MVLSENIGNDEEVIYIHRSKKKNKRSELPAGRKLAPQPSKVVELMDSQEDKKRVEINSKVNLPQTGNFGGYKPAADKSDGGKTVMNRDQSPNLLEDDSADISQRDWLSY
jgi:hypothetical protein